MKKVIIVMSCDMDYFKNHQTNLKLIQLGVQVQLIRKYYSYGLSASRSRYKRYQKKLNRRALPSLVNNFSKLNLDENMESLLNKSLSFVPTPKHFDKTNIEAGLQKFKRSLLWREYWHDSICTTQSDTKVKQVFFDKCKTNLQPIHADFIKHIQVKEYAVQMYFFN